MNSIGDYALIGDCHSAALVGRDGSIDWACFPRFDSPSAFAAILDPVRGGSFSVRAERTRATHRAYLPDTNVLVTTFETDSGVIEVTDCMPVTFPRDDDPTAVASDHALLRRARCVAGDAVVTVRCAPRFEYGRFVPRFRVHGYGTGDIVGGADALTVRSTGGLEASQDALEARWHMRAGEDAWIETRWTRSYRHRTPEPIDGRPVFERRLDQTIDFWRSWVGRSWYEGRHESAVRRSALVLKALTFAPSGALVAAPTTSLPERLGGTRNWDYRYTWIRDATLTLQSLLILGYREEADAFKTWVERTGAGRPEDLQIMYGIGGERALPELELDHLSGHRGSRPVRIGNGAVKQVQLDVYGQLFEAAWLYARAGGGLTPDNWRFLSGLADIICDAWQRPDQGIWEIRDEPRHFTHSKLNCWIALDRAVRLAATLKLPGSPRWAAERDQIRAALLADAAPDGWFQQAIGHGVADASTLLVPASGFLATTDPLVERTIEVVRRQLERDGLVYRYRSPDGIHDGEGAFLLCSFWLLDCLIHSGRVAEAAELLDRLLGFANDVGLLAEEIDPSTGEALGNMPQAFSHMAVVTSCAHLAAAERGDIPPGPQNYAELALDRLIARARAGVMPPAGA